MSYIKVFYRVKKYTLKKVTETTSFDLHLYIFSRKKTQISSAIIIKVQVDEGHYCKFSYKQKI